MTRICRIALGFVLCLLAVGATGYAQVSTGTVSGTVEDSSGGGVPKASLTLTQASTGLVLNTSSDTSGRFVFPNVEPGEYVLKIEKTGFRTLQKSGITLQTGQRVALGTITLSLGSVAQTVTVSAAAPLVDTETAAHQDYLTSTQVNSQLMFGRNIATLVTLVPGIEGGGADASLDRSGGGFSSQGSRTDTNRFSVDGINSTDIDNGGSLKMQQSVDSIAEVTILKNNYEAEYGNASGAMVIEVTKSGTKDFHGSVDYYTKNEFFDANSYFNKRNGLKRPTDRIHNINYNIGGPVTFGHFNRNRDKLFFFWNQEFWPTSGSAPYSMTVPTDLERAGDFSQSYEPDGKTLRVITDPTTGLPFPGNKVPADRLDSSGQGILNAFPHANFFNTSISKNQYNYVGEASFSTPNRTSALRIDYDVSSKDRISGTWTTFHEVSEGFTGTSRGFTGANWPMFIARFTARNNGLSAHWIHTFSNFTVNEASFAWETNPEHASATTPGAFQSTYNLSLPTLSPNGNPDHYMPGLSFGGVPNAAAIGTGIYEWLTYNAPNNVFNWTDKLSLVRGTHFIKTGVEVMHFWRDIPSNSTRYGDYNFGTSSLNPLDTGYAYSNAILGIFQSYQETNGQPRQKGRGGEYDVFVQDTWQALPRLSLDYGVRIEYILPLTQGDNKWAAFSPSAYNPSEAVTLYQPGTNTSGQRVAVDPITGAQFPQAYIGAIVPGAGVPFNGMVSPYLNSNVPSGATDNRGVQLMPRFGFAWDVFGDHKTSVRGGAGIFTSPVPMDQYRSRSNQPPLFETPEVFYSTISNLKTASQVIFPSSVLGEYYNDKIPVSYNMNLGVERDIGFGTILGVSYVGALGRELLITRNLNAIPFGTDFLARDQDPTTGHALPQLLLRPIQGYGDIMMQVYGGSSNYHSLQVSANRRSGNWIYGINYTWSKAMDYGSADQSQLSTLVPVRIWNYGPADFDQRQALKANWLWSLPPSPWNNAVAKTVLSGWGFSGDAFFLSGTPVTPSFSTTVPIDFTGSPTDGARLDMNGNPNLPGGNRTFSHAFQTSVFSLPAVGSYGTMRRNALYQPGSQTWNFAFIKTFHFTERVALEVRAEMYNAFNHANFSNFGTNAIFNTKGTPATNPNWGQQINPGFGQYTATLDPRKMQLGARLSF